MGKNGSTVDLFVDRIKTARTIMDMATRRLSEQNLDKNLMEKDFIQAYITRVQQVCKFLNEAHECINTIMARLNKEEYPSISDKVKEISDKISKIQTYCDTISKGRVESDFIEIHVNLITEVKIGLNHLNTSGSDFILKNVKSLICKTP